MGGVLGILANRRRRRRVSRATLLASPFRDPQGVDVSAIVSPDGWYGAPRYRKGNDTSGTQMHDGEKWPFDHFHTAVDLEAAPGSRVYSLGRGKVIAAFPGSPGGGACRIGLVAQLDNGYAVVFCDLGKRLVELGAHLEEDTPVGIVGRRGFVHVDVQRPRGTHINPAGLFPFTSRNA